MAFFASQVITVDDTVKSLTVPSNGYPQSALISVQDYPIRIAFGEDPNNTTKNGLYIPAGQTFEITGVRDLTSLRMTQAELNAAVVSVLYEQA